MSTTDTLRTVETLRKAGATRADLYRTLLIQAALIIVALVALLGGTQ